jgi:hypothetical protein
MGGAVTMLLLSHALLQNIRGGYFTSVTAGSLRGRTWKTVLLGNGTHLLRFYIPPGNFGRVPSSHGYIQGLPRLRPATQQMEKAKNIAAQAPGTIFSRLAKH